MIIAKSGGQTPGLTDPLGVCPSNGTQKVPFPHPLGVGIRQGAESRFGTSDFLACLHHRITDRIAWPHGRAWLQEYSHLDLGERNGWPVLVLELEEAPDPHWILPKLLRDYKEAAISGKASGPLSDLAGSLELREAGR
jgi:hypothetical protein